ncbi:MAG: leucine-rich repeat domain-containing protein [Phycisphaerae bacterium]|nr:leucine-rich repeat domain-containing protein [Phycisphaerae bacterium]
MDENKLLEFIAKAGDRGYTEIDLSHSDLTSIPRELTSLTDLQRLFLSHNRLVSVPCELAQLTGLQGLDLSGNQLTTIPPELGQLTNLQVLDLSSNELTFVPRELARLANLQVLYLQDNQLTAIPRELTSLNNLQWLNLSENHLTSIPPELAEMTNLRRLYLSRNQLASVPRELARLAKLEVLYLAVNELTVVAPELTQLRNLEDLDLYHNRLRSIPAELARLTNLRRLNLFHNQLASIPPELGSLERLEQLHLGANPLVTPPREIIDQGTAAVLTYLRGTAKVEKHKWEAKLLVVGEASVGKTELVKALHAEDYGGETATQGVQIRTLKIEHPSKTDVTMSLNLWDFGGQEIQHATHQFFYSERALFVLVWNARENYEQAKLNTWLELIQARASIPADETGGREEWRAPVLLVATHCDLWKPDVPYEELKKQFPRIRLLGLHEVSNKTRRGIDELREALTEAAAELPLMGTPWPADWQKAEDELGARVEAKQSRINLHDLWTLMDSAGVAADSRELLSRALDGMGKIRVFLDDEELRQVVVLDPQWLTNRIARVLKNEDQHGKAICRHAILHRVHWSIFWPEEDETTHRLFARMMRNFDLVYAFEDSLDEWLVVQLLPYQLAEEDKRQFDELWSRFDGQREITMNFRLDQSIPPGIPTWFIAREHRFSVELHWRLGVLLADEPKDPKHIGLVQAFPEQRYIQLTVRGPLPHNFFVLLRDGLEYTLARFPGLNIRRCVPCPGHTQPKCRHEFDLRQLSKAIEKDKPKLEMECPEELENISVPGMLFGIHWSTEGEIVARIEELETKVLGGQELIRTELGELRKLSQYYFLVLFNTQQRLEESHCPNVFAVLPEGESGWLKSLLGQKMIMRLYCQAPGQWHPTIEGGRYEIKRPAEFLKSMGPYILKLARVIKYAGPIAWTAAGALGGPLGAGIGAQQAKDLVYQIRLMEELAKRLCERDFLPADLLERIGGEARAERFEGAELRALRKLLDEVDPKQQWGGLKKVLTPEGHWLWLCDEHAKEYK